MLQEEINNEVQIRLAVHDEKFNSFTREMQSFKDEMQDFKQEMRKQNEMRAAEIAEFRQSIREIYQATDAKFDSINKSIASMQNQNIFVIIGVIAIAVAVFLK